MENKDIYELIDKFEASSLSTLEIEEDGTKICMKKGNDLSTEAQGQPLIQPFIPPVFQPMMHQIQPGMTGMAEMQGMAGTQGMAVGAGQTAEQPNNSEQALGQKPENKYTEIKAPLVGLFYTTPSPDAEPFVKVGDKIEQGQVLCILEAMKMMNELKSPVSGVVKRILPSHGSPVEFDQVLFEVEEC